jgi:DNA-binding NarL/FixJ family response regulator
MRGNKVLCSMATSLLDQSSAQEVTLPTPKEMDVLRALARGRKNKDIADEMSVSVHTIEYHVHNLFLKLNATSRADALMRAQRLGWLDMTEPLC